MLRRGLALAALAIAACHDAPARPRPRPTAPVQASRALLEQALTLAIADANKARTLVPPPPAPTALLDDPARLAAVLADDPDALQGLVGGLTGTPDDPADDPGGVVGGITGGQLGQPPPPLPSSIIVQLLTDSDGLDGATLGRLTSMVRMSGRACLAQASYDTPITDAITATVTISSTPGTGAIVIHVSDGRPIAPCLGRMLRGAALPAGATVTFQITIPPP